VSAAEGARPLKPRQELILRTVVEEHIATGTPVGSKNIAGREGIDFASSTVRYELARLEELGFLDHPHTSAGRVPTDQGYRYYVDTLLVRDPPERAPAMVRAALDTSEMRREIDAALGRLADVVAQVTNLLGIVTAPPPES
jgi:heat-inducible transcriptional repressor